MLYAKCVFIELVAPVVFFVKNTLVSVLLPILNLFHAQAIKVVDFFRYWLVDGRTTRYTIKWLVVDALYCLCLAFLRIPRLNYKLSVVILQILTLTMLNGFMFGGITINLGLGGSWGIPVVRFHSAWWPSVHSLDLSNIWF